MKVYVLSDIHLEFYKRIPTPLKRFPLDSATSILCLAGDISVVGNSVDHKLITWLLKCCKHFLKVIYVPGNHEYFQDSTKPITTCDSTDRWFSRFSNVYNVNNFVFLNEGRTYNIDNLCFIGATMWSPIPKGLWEMTQKSISNHSRIWYKKQIPWTPEVQTAVFEDHYWGVEQSLQSRNSNNKIIIITHYIPHIDLACKNNEFNSSFVFPGERLLRLADIWIYGHTHTVKNPKTNINGCICVSNPLGYPDESPIMNPWNVSFDN